MMPEVHMTEEAFVRESLPKIHEEDCKFDRGRLLLVAGSYGMAGAVILSARAALRTGVGYLTLLLPKSIYPLVTAAVPEAVCRIYDTDDPEKMREQFEAALSKADAVAIGPGLGTLRGAVMDVILSYFSPENGNTKEENGVFRKNKKLLIDADGLNALSELGVPASVFPALVSADLLLTPHEGEMARLLTRKDRIKKEERQEVCLQAARMFQASILLKGKGTLIMEAPKGSLLKANKKDPEKFRIFQNPTGGPGLARAGSGDVLTGITGALMAQGMDAFTAGVSGAYLHGLAGDLAARAYGVRSMLPSDVIEKLPEALSLVEKI